MRITLKGIGLLTSLDSTKQKCVDNLSLANQLNQYTREH